MSSTESLTPEALVQMCGGYARAVDVVTALGRALWKVAFERDVETKWPSKILNEERLLNELSSDDVIKQQPSDLPSSILDTLCQKELCWKRNDVYTAFKVDCFQPVFLTRQLLGGVRPDHELRYFVMRSIQQNYGYKLSSDTAHLFHLLAKSLDSCRRGVQGESPFIQLVDLKDPTGLVLKLRDGVDPTSAYLRQRLSDNVIALLRDYDSSNIPSELLQAGLVKDLNGLIEDAQFFSPVHFTGDVLSPKTQRQIRRKMGGEERLRMNRKLLENVYRKEIGTVEDRRKAVSRRNPDQNVIFNFTQEVLPNLRPTLKGDRVAPADFERFVDFFIECCRAVDYIRVHKKDGCISLQTAAIDAEYLLVSLFGMSTDMRGFDELFGGGIILGGAEWVGSSAHFRTVLVQGRFGSGKSLLCLQLAAEVARKGGLAWVVALEQRPEECKYTLESMCVLPVDNSVAIALNSSEIGDVLKPKDGLASARGGLIILGAAKDSFADFRRIFEVHAEQMGAYPLRLICVDPLNAVSRASSDVSSLRSDMQETLGRIKAAKANVLLVVEEGSATSDDLFFAQNIADTVIRLSVEPRHGYSGRYLEITKSRRQREQRGQHPFSIIPGEGIRVLPSSSAISAKIRSRSVFRPGNEIAFGLSTLDTLLGQRGLYRGDVVVLQGGTGTFKTQLGILFLLESESDNDGSKVQHKQKNKPENRTSKSLLVAARDNESTVRHLLEQPFVRKRLRAGKSKAVDDIRILALPRGNVSPSYVIQRLEDEFLEARLKDYWIDRVMIADIAHWEMSCPFFRDDETFADTLTDFLRRQRVTSLLTCEEAPQDVPSVVQRSIIDNADCLIHLNRAEHRGVDIVRIKVIKTRDMRHHKDAFEVDLDETLEVKPGSMLLHETRDGALAPVNTRLFLRSETALQHAHNKGFLKEVQAVLSRSTEIDTDRFFMETAQFLGSVSAVDELQIVQLDEFQLPKASEEGPGPLFPFSIGEWDDKEWSDFLPRLDKRVYTNDRFFAVPYYLNVSLLAYRGEGLNASDFPSWDSLADKASTGEIFFDFPHTSGEDYNSLFLEILAWLKRHSSESKPVQLLDWLRSEQAIDAAILFRKLCAQSCLNETGGDLSRLEGINSHATVWRHWYSTLNQMLSEMNARDRRAIHVRPLPGDIATAGESYLAVPAYSAAPEVGLKIIKRLTSREAEAGRLRRGVGLPTRSKFYNDRLGPTGGSDALEGTTEADVSPYFSINARALSKLVHQPLTRSSFRGYSEFSGSLTDCLKRIIEVPDRTEDAMRKRFKDLFHDIEQTP